MPYLTKHSLFSFYIEFFMLFLAIDYIIFIIDIREMTMLKNIFNRKQPSVEGFKNALFNKIFNPDEINFHYSEKVNLYKTTEKKETLLHLCAKFAYIESIKWLLNKGLSLEAQTEDKETVLFYAVKSNNIATVKFLVEQGANVNHKNFYHRTALQEAILSGSKTYKYLLEKTTDLNNSDFYGNSIIFHAISSGDDELLDNVLKNENLNINCVNKNNDTVLNYAVNNYLKEKESPKSLFYFKLIKKLLDFKIDINNLNQKKENILFQAIKEEDIKLINLFLSQKIDITQKNYLGYTVLEEACFKGYRNIEVIKALLELGVDVNQRDNEGSTLIEKLIDLILYYENKKEISFYLVEKSSDENNYFELLKYLLQNTKVDLNKYTSKSKPLFFDTILYYNFKLFKLLQKSGIDVNQNDLEHNNVLSYLIENADTSTTQKQKLYLNTLQSLINLGVNINNKDNLGSTVIHKAILNSSIYTIKVLLDAKPNYKSVDNNGRTFIHNIVWKDCTKTFKLVHSYDNSVLNIADNYGILPINYAVFMGRYDLVINMIDEFAHVNNTNQISPKMKDFFKKFHNNLNELTKHAKNNVDVKNLRILSDNMKKEFSI
ncbi:hypothetical protein CRU97_11955 [Halarcobacter bivalviorum]|nr:hypothetical protein CRU97_11955 [Halarcobacter bivalviorum]